MGCPWLPDTPNAFQLILTLVELPLGIFKAAPGPVFAMHAVQKSYPASGELCRWQESDRTWTWCPLCWRAKGIVYQLHFIVSPCFTRRYPLNTPVIATLTSLIAGSRSTNSSTCTYVAYVVILIVLYIYWITDIRARDLVQVYNLLFFAWPLTVVDMLLSMLAERCKKYWLQLNVPRQEVWVVCLAVVGLFGSIWHTVCQ